MEINEAKYNIMFVVRASGSQGKRRGGAVSLPRDLSRIQLPGFECPWNSTENEGLLRTRTRNLIGLYHVQQLHVLCLVRVHQISDMGSMIRRSRGRVSDLRTLHIFAYERGFQTKRIVFSYQTIWI